MNEKIEIHEENENIADNETNNELRGDFKNEIKNKKITAIIAEFNPLHRGHEYIIQRSKELTGNENVIIIQSGNFVQRAVPAVMDKFTRGRHAIMAGASAVVEIPTMFATGNAEVFAKGSVRVAASFDGVTHLAFGIEADELEILESIASVMVTQEKKYRKIIKPMIKQGESYDTARTKAVAIMLPGHGKKTIEKVMSTANNKLGIEYLKELKRIKSNIIPIGIKRQDGVSSTNIRVQISNVQSGHNGGHGDALENLGKFGLSKHVDATGALRKHNFDIYGNIALYSLRTKLTEEIYNANTEILNRIKNLSVTTFREYLETAPTKRYTISRMSRLALHAILGVNKSDIGMIYKCHKGKKMFLPYANLLGARREIVPTLISNTNTHIMFKGNPQNNNTAKRLNENFAQRLQEIDTSAQTLYEVISAKKQMIKPVFV